MEFVVIALVVIATIAISYGLGRKFGGSWMGVFIVLMIIAGGLIAISGTYETGEYAGLGAVLIGMFVWLPVLVCGLIGAAVGWGSRGRTSPPPMPENPLS